jgi:hypothetical protein
VSETINTAEIAKKILRDILKQFFWELRPPEDHDFECSLSHHTSESGKSKKTHPCDAILFYHDPYLNKKIYLHTDLKSYAKNTLKQKNIRNEINSLAMALECARVSESWKRKFPTDRYENYEVRGLLFVANHDNEAPLDFQQQLSKISKSNLKIAKGQVIHVLGPKQISDLFAIATDIKCSIQDRALSQRYRFFYPDLTLWKRTVADDVCTAATIESLLSPFFIIKHDAVADEYGREVLCKGSLVYYSRPGTTVDEFVYLLDSLLRYQLVKANEIIRIRVVGAESDTDLRSTFDQAKYKYCREWGFESTREEEIMSITIDTIQRTLPNYSPGKIGWKEYE